MDDNWAEDHLPHSDEDGGSEEDGGSAGNTLPEEEDAQFLRGVGREQQPAARLKLAASS
jgi:hypothetical protein